MVVACQVIGSHGKQLWTARHPTAAAAIQHGAGALAAEARTQHLPITGLAVAKLDAYEAGAPLFVIRNVGARPSARGQGQS